MKRYCSHFQNLVFGIMLGLVIPGAAFALSGFVSDQKNIGLERALVEVQVDGKLHRVYTGAQGGFRLENLPQNKAYTLVVRKSGYSQNSAQGNTSSVGEVLLQLQEQMVKLNATVLTRDGKPIQNVLVDGKTLGVKVSDASGKVSFTVPYGAAYVLKPSFGNYYFRSAISGVAEGDVERVIAGESN